LFLLPLTSAINDLAQQLLPQMVQDLEALVALESPSDIPAAVNQVADFLAQWLHRYTTNIQLHPVDADTGNLLTAYYPAQAANNDLAPIMLLGHLDTVWPLGTTAQRPSKIQGSHFYGPGSFDMKGGLIIAIYALTILQQLALPLRHPLLYCFTPAEELGGLRYRTEFETLAHNCAYALDFEPAWPGGAVKTTRKGCARAKITVTGRASHAGATLEQGVNAILEIIEQIRQIQTFASTDLGITVNVGRIDGGTRANVVPEMATAEFDLRFRTLAAGQALLEKFSRLQPHFSGSNLAVEAQLLLPPLEPNPAAIQLYEQARQLAQELGFTLSETATGGASEAGVTAALGIPTLDGLGADGDGAHAQHEHVYLPSLANRAALVAQLLTTL
jgi:glutamate carboxypeptidase